MPSLKEKPAVNIPSQLLLLSALLIVCFLISDSLSPLDFAHTVRRFALYPDRYFGSGSEALGGSASALWSLFTYSLLHDGWEHLIFNLAWLVIFGSVIARHLGSTRFFLFYAFCAIAAALVYVLFHLRSGYPAIGASGAVFGMFGAMMRFLFPERGGILGEVPRSLEKTFRNRRVLTIIAVVLGIDLVFATVMGITGAGAIAWEAHLGGFLSGLLCFGLFAPPGRSRSGGPGGLDYGEWR